MDNLGMNLTNIMLYEGIKNGNKVIFMTEFDKYMSYYRNGRDFDNNYNVKIKENVELYKSLNNIIIPISQSFNNKKKFTRVNCKYFLYVDDNIVFFNINEYNIIQEENNEIRIELEYEKNNEYYYKNELQFSHIKYLKLIFDYFKINKINITYYKNIEKHIDNIVNELKKIPNFTVDIDKISVF